MMLHVEWGRSNPLRDGSRQNLIYTLDPNKVPATSGLYVFGRRSLPSALGRLGVVQGGDWA